MEAERRIKTNPLFYTPQHQKQFEASQSSKAIRSLFWGNRVGKTEWGAQEIVRYVTGYTTQDVTVVDKYKKAIKGKIDSKAVHLPIEIWCACPSFDQQKETTQKKLERYLPKEIIKHISYVKNGVWSEVTLIDGTRINFKSYEQGREKFQGAGKRLIWFDEEPPKDIWEECFVRAEAGIPLDIIMTMTPVNGMTWVYDEIYLDTDNPDLYVSEAEWDDNPFLEDRQKAQMARGLSPEALQVRRQGKFIKKVGLVCPWWQRGIHCIEMKFNPNWIIVGAIDYGFSNPSCFGLFGIDFDDNIHLFDGFYERGLTIPKTIERIERICQSYGLTPNDFTIVADSAQQESIQQMLDAGLSVIGIKKQPGTDNQNWDEYRADKMAQYGEVVEGKSKFYVSNGLKTFDEKMGKEINWFVKEAESLKWSEVASFVGKEKQQGATWDPRYPNHAIDMFSYMIIDHLEAPERPTPQKPWAGKQKGTYIEPSILEEDENDFGQQGTYTDYDDV